MSSNTSPNPLAYTGLDPQVNPQSISVERAPNINDWQSFYPGDQWRDTSVTPNVWYILRSVAGNQASWEAYTGGSGTVVTIIADSGSATPSGGAITVSGGSTGLTTSASGSTVDLTGTLNVAHGGTGDNSLAAHNVLIGAGTSAVAVVAPSSTSGVPLVSQGSSSDPHFGTAVVAGGGTGLTTASTNTSCLLATGTTATGNFQIIPNGTPGQILTATSGIPGWGSGRFSSINIQTITTTGIYTPSVGMLYCIAEICGGGGGGGGVTNSQGGGGGGAGYARSVFSATTIGISQAVTIGSGGAGGAIATDGSDGGTTSIGALISATGGAGGKGGNNIALLQGGVGGTGTGTISITGQTGGGALNGTNGFGGSGGSSIFGFGAPINTSGTASAGVGFGSGGSGASAGGSATGGDGAPGVCIVTEYIG